MNDTRRKWVAAAATLAADPSARIRCPNCDDDYLSVSDVSYEADPTIFSRYLRCSGAVQPNGRDEQAERGEDAKERRQK